MLKKILNFIFRYSLLILICSIFILTCKNESSQLLEDLKSQDSQVRLNAVKKLADLKDPNAICPLMKAFEDENFLIRWSAVFTLFNMSGTRLNHVIIPESESNNITKKEIEKLRKAGFIAIIEKKLEDSAFQWYAGGALAKLSNPFIWLSPRINVTELVPEKKLKKYRKKLSECLKWAIEDDNPLMRDIAVEASGRLYIRELLIKAMEDSEKEIRERAIGWLVTNRDKMAIEPLISRLKTEDNELVIRGTILSLREITGEDIGDTVDKWEKWWKENKDKFLKKP